MTLESGLSPVTPDIPGIVMQYEKRHRAEIQMYARHNVAMPTLHVADRRLSLDDIPVLGEDGLPMTPERRQQIHESKCALTPEPWGQSAVKNRPGIRVVQPRPAVDWESVKKSLDGMDLSQPIESVTATSFEQFTAELGRLYDRVTDYLGIEPLSVIAPAKLVERLGSVSKSRKYRLAHLLPTAGDNVTILGDIMPFSNERVHAVIILAFELV